MNVEAKEPGVLSVIEKLLILQDRDRKIKQLGKEIEDIPARKQLIDSRLNEHRGNVHAAQEELKKKISAAKQLDIEVETLKARILKLREQQNSVRTNDEYRAIEHEIANVNGQIRGLEDREIEIMEATEQAKAVLQEMEKSLKQEEAVVKTDMVAMDERLKNIQGEADGLKAGRGELAAGIPDDWLSRYDRTFKHTGDFALVPAEKNGSCGGCHMKLPPQVIQDVKRNQNMIACSFCGRILYWQS